jgi:hypothetical protein
MNYKNCFSFLSLIFLLLVFTVININCSSSYTKEDNPKTWKHFNILASSEDDIIFVQLQDDLGISPKMERYILTVNITDNKNPVIIIGGEQNPSAKVFSWSVLRKFVQSGLLNWTGSNKEKLY